MLERTGKIISPIQSFTNLENSLQDVHNNPNRDNLKKYNKDYLITRGKSWLRLAGWGAFIGAGVSSYLKYISDIEVPYGSAEFFVQISTLGATKLGAIFGHGIFKLRSESLQKKYINYDLSQKIQELENNYYDTESNEGSEKN